MKSRKNAAFGPIVNSIGLGGVGAGCGTYNVRRRIDRFLKPLYPAGRAVGVRETLITRIQS